MRAGWDRMEWADDVRADLTSILVMKPALPVGHLARVHAPYPASGRVNSVGGTTLCFCTFLQWACSPKSGSLVSPAPVSKQKCIYTHARIARMLKLHSAPHGKGFLSCLSFSLTHTRTEKPWPMCTHAHARSGCARTHTWSAACPPPRDPEIDGRTDHLLPWGHAGSPCAQSTVPCA